MLTAGLTFAERRRAAGIATSSVVPAAPQLVAVAAGPSFAAHAVAQFKTATVEERQCAVAAIRERWPDLPPRDPVPHHAAPSPDPPTARVVSPHASDDSPLAARRHGPVTREVLAARRGISYKDIKGEREAELILRYQAGDRHAGEILLRAHARIIAYSVRRYRARWHDLEPDDLLAEAQLGFLEGVRKFDPSLGITLTTYALHWSRQGAMRSVHDTGTAIRVPVNQHNKRKRDRDDPRAHAARNAMRLLRLDAPIGGEGDEGDSYGDHTACGAPLADERLSTEEERILVARVVDCAGLSDTERAIIERRVLADEPETLKEIGDSFGRCRERVRQLEETALHKLRKAYANLSDGGNAARRSVGPRKRRAA